MKKLLSFSLTLFVIYFTYGLFLNRFEVTIIPKELQASNPPGYYDYKGVINVHTIKSTGSGTFRQVIEAAQESGLDYIFFTDVNNFEKSNKREGYYNKTLAMVGGEYSYLDSRLLNIGASNDDHLQGPGRSQALFADLLSQRHKDIKKGILILAHPFKPGFEWTGPYPIGLDGLEIINLKAIWQNAWLHQTASFLWTLLVYPFNSELAFIRLFHPPQRQIDLWDQLAKKRKTIAIAGSAAEAKLKFFSFGYLKVPSYQTLFNIVSNHVLIPSELTGNAKSDIKKIVNAIRHGEFYVSFDMLANPKGFYTYIKGKRGKIFNMGDTVPLHSPLELVVNLPRKPLVPFETVIFKNGQRMLGSNSKETRYEIHSPGVYRVMVRVIPTLPLPDGKQWIPWIYTNPFYVTP